MAGQPEVQARVERRAERQLFEASVQFRAGARRASVHVRDISHLGARVIGVFLVREDETFWIKLASLDPVEARVAWVENFEFGCEFVRPLNEAVLESILRTA